VWPLEREREGRGEKGEEGAAGRELDGVAREGRGMDERVARERMRLRRE